MSKEVLLVVESVSNEKGVPPGVIFEALEVALATATKKRFEDEVDLRVEINRHTGNYETFRRWTVVDEQDLDDPAIETWLEKIHETHPEAKVGDVIEEKIDSIEFGRIAAQTAKQVIVQKVREAERAQVVDAYRERVGEIISGTVKKVTRDNVIVDLGNNAEALLAREDIIPRETFRVGVRLRALLKEIRTENRGPQLILSRTAPQMLIELFTIEVPEIAEGLIEVMAASRDPGSRAKIAVISNDSSIDPVGACVGMRGSRVQAVVGELQGEKIDIIPWSQEPASFIVNALQPAEVAKVVLDEESERIEVVVPDEQLSLAIGRRGQNVRLASQLTGWDIDIMTEQEESERRQKEFNERTNLFMEALDVDEMVGQVLASEGFAQVEELAYVELDEISSIDGFDEDTAVEIQTRAKEYLDRVEAEMDAKRKELGVADELRQIDGLTSQMMVALGEDGIKTIEDFAGCAADDLVGWTERKDGETKKFDGIFSKLDVSRVEAENMVLQARLLAGWITEEELAAEQQAAEEADTAVEE